MEATGQNPGSKESLVGQLIGVHVAMIALATLTVLGRLFVRLTSTKSGLGGDDITILISLALTIAFVTINLYRTLTFHRHRVAAFTIAQLSIHHRAC